MKWINAAAFDFENAPIIGKVWAKMPDVEMEPDKYDVVRILKDKDGTNMYVTNIVYKIRGDVKEPLVIIEPLVYKYVPVEHPVVAAEKQPELNLAPVSPLKDVVQVFAEKGVVVQDDDLNFGQKMLMDKATGKTLARNIPEHKLYAYIGKLDWLYTLTSSIQCQCAGSEQTMLDVVYDNILKAETPELIDEVIRGALSIMYKDEFDKAPLEKQQQMMEDFANMLAELPHKKDECTCDHCKC